MENPDQAAHVENQMLLGSSSQEPIPLQIEQALSAILANPAFSASKQSQRLLQYLVDQTLQGHDEMLKERMIGINVFDRNADYNTGDDPIVRVRAADLRKRLAQYYTAEGKDDPIRIEILRGAYHPVFTAFPNSESSDRAIEDVFGAQPPGAIHAETFKLPGSNRSAAARWFSLLHRRHYLAIGTALCLLSLLAAGLAYRTRKTAADLFWEPVLSNSEPVLIFFGGNAVYYLSSEVEDTYSVTQVVPQQGREFFVDFPTGTKIDAKDIIRAKNFVMVNDFAAAAEVITFLNHRSKLFELRWGHDISTGDLRHAPVILIGAFNNYLTLELSEQLRYQFTGGTQIKDRLNPQRSWSFTRDAKGNWADDYAIVSRINRPKTGVTIVTAAGIEENGTQAAGEFLNSPQLIANAVKGLPSDWNNKNMQILLHVKASDGVNAGYNAPYSIEVVSVHLW